MPPIGIGGQTHYGENVLLTYLLEKQISIRRVHSKQSRFGNVQNKTNGDIFQTSGNLSLIVRKFRLSDGLPALRNPFQSGQIGLGFDFRPACGREYLPYGRPLIPAVLHNQAASGFQVFRTVCRQFADAA